MKRRGILSASLAAGLVLIFAVSFCFAQDKNKESASVNLTDQVNKLLTIFNPVLKANKITIKNEIFNNRILLKKEDIVLNILSNAIACAPEGSKIIISFDHKNSLVVTTIDASTRFDVKKKVNLEGYIVDFESRVGVGSKFEINLTPAMCTVY